MIEHSERAFYHHDKIKFKENREFTKLYYKGIGTGQDKGNSQEETETFFDEQKKYACTTKQTVSDIRLMSYNVVNDKISVKKRAERESVCVERGECSHQLNCVCMYVCKLCKTYFYYQEMVRARTSTS